MSEFVLSCSSTVDLSNEYLKERNIPYVSFHLQLGEDTYADDMGQSISQEELFKRMLDGEDAKTSQVTVQQYLDFFKGFLEEGKDILHISLSSGISGTYNSACVAAEVIPSGNRTQSVDDGKQQRQSIQQRRHQSQDIIGRRGNKIGQILKYVHNRLPEILYSERAVCANLYANRQR